MGRHHIGVLKEFKQGQCKIVEVENKSIGIYNLGGELYGLRNICPHQNAPLCRGVIGPLIVSHAPNTLEYEREGEIVHCPWHSWEFDIKTGCLIVDPKMRTKSYEVTVERFDVSVEDGDVYIQV
ncbi:Rieske (2Fe-2S) protein [Brevibacillus sp. B_LB10_24]|uniref:Rieske (2Fe-2S) protein n=1 Tax=Brevibacillus sp. B_LB10_24 TaxID=3380645 RepID=UPI0038BDCEA2